MAVALILQTFLKEFSILQKKVHHLKILKGLKLVLIINLFCFSCNQRDSTTAISRSDNVTFENRKYNNQEPIRPFGNLPNSKEPEPQSIQYYTDLVNSKYGVLSENDRYFIWLANERKKRLEAGKRNDFKSETMPSYNDYYLRKSKAVKGNTSINEIRLKDIEKKIEETKQKGVEEKKIENIDEIDSYEILGPMPDNEWNEKVDDKDYTGAIYHKL